MHCWNDTACVDERLHCRILHSWSLHLSNWLLAVSIRVLLAILQDWNQEHNPDSHQGLQVKGLPWPVVAASTLVLGSSMPCIIMTVTPKLLRQIPKKDNLHQFYCWAWSLLRPNMLPGTLRPWPFSYVLMVQGHLWENTLTWALKSCPRGIVTESKTLVIVSFPLSSAFET